MTDLELDELLNTWEAPSAPHRLRSRVLELEDRRVRTAAPVRWFGKTAALVSAIAVLLVAVRAFPQDTSPTPPYTVDSEFITYGPEGTPTVRLYATSFAQNGAEQFVSRSLAGDPLGTLWMRTIGIANRLMDPLNRLVLPFLVAPELLERRRKIVETMAEVPMCVGDDCASRSYWLIGDRAELLSSGCRAGEVTARATILNYPTVALQRETGIGRLTVWLAPDLGCFPLRVMIERQNADGSFRPVQRKESFKVTVNKP